MSVSRKQKLFESEVKQMSRRSKTNIWQFFCSSSFLDFLSFLGILLLLLLSFCATPTTPFVFQSTFRVRKNSYTVCTDFSSALKIVRLKFFFLAAGNVKRKKGGFNFKTTLPPWCLLFGVASAHRPPPHPTACRPTSCSITTVTGSSQAQGDGVFRLCSDRFFVTLTRPGSNSGNSWVSAWFCVSLTGYLDY